MEHIAYDMAQDASGIMYYATRSGVLQFDGRNWELIEGNGAIYSIEICKDNSIYWSGANGFGRVTTQEDGSKKISLISKPADHEIYQAICFNDHIFFLGDDGIRTLSEKDSIQTIPATQLTGSFTYLFEYYGRILVATDKAQVFELNNGELRMAAFDIDNLDIVFATKFESEYILGTLDNKLFISTGPGQVEQISLSDDSYINASVVVDGAWVNRNLVALATLRGGVIFLNPRTGKIEEIINYHTGLPDNEVLSLMSDQNRNIWIAHEYGFTRIEPFLPFRSFSRYEGLRGNLLCAKAVNGDVYVGTSLGLYKLVREELYDEIVYYENIVTEIEQKPDGQPNEPEVKPREASQPVVVEKEHDEPEKKKKGFFNFLKRKRATVEESTSHESVAGVETKPGTAATESNETASVEQVTHSVKKTERFLRSSEYVYKKVGGIDAKVSHLTVLNEKLIAAGLGGVFEVADQTAKVILEEPVRFIYTSASDILFVSTYADRVATLRFTNNKWEDLRLLPNLDDQISFAFEGRDNNIWLCGYDVLFDLKMEQYRVKEIIKTNFDNPNFARTLGVRMNDEVIFVNTNGFYKRDSNGLARIDSLGSPQKYFVTNGTLLYYDNHSWKQLGSLNDANNIHMLNIAEDIRFMDANGNPNHLWIITGNNELYKFFGDRLSVPATRYPLAIKSIIQGETRQHIGKKLKVDQESGALTFEVVQPNFTGANAIEYRYFLKGINDDWSEWSVGNNKISFPFLPVGDYKLSVQARDIFGHVTEMEPKPFQVQPPFWKQPWFYALEFSIFSLLVLLSFKLSVRYRFVSRLLSLLTIILLIEFIQTIAGSAFTTDSSPIIDFAIQVGVAFLILPVEGYLRDLMFRSMGEGSKLYDVISELNKSGKQRK